MKKSETPIFEDEEAVWAFNNAIKYYSNVFEANFNKSIKRKKANHGPV